LSFLTTSAFLLLATFSWGQVASLEKIILEVTFGYSPVTLEIIKDEQEVSTLEIGEGIKLRGFEHGYYKFNIAGLGKSWIWTESILVQKGQALEFAITLDGPCLYDHPPGYIPICPENHTDNIIPIVYGLIIQIGDSKRDEFLRGGCVVTDCDPNYYCKVHEVKF